MSIDLGGLQSLIEVVNNHPQGMIPVQRAIELLTELRVSWKLSCRLERRQECIYLKTSEHDIGPVELRVEMPHGHEHVALGDTNQVGPRTFERRGSFGWPMDRFGLTVSYDGRQETIDVFGPYLATLARGYLTDETI